MAEQRGGSSGNSRAISALTFGLWLCRASGSSCSINQPWRLTSFLCTWFLVRKSLPLALFWADQMHFCSLSLCLLRVERRGEARCKKRGMMPFVRRSFEANKELLGLGRVTLQPCRAAQDRLQRSCFIVPRLLLIWGVQSSSLLIFLHPPCLGLSVLLCCCCLG